MRYAQMVDSLNAVRKILKIKARMIQFKNKNLRGQRDGTRSRSVIDRVHERARASAAKYRAAREAYFTLAGEGEWEKRMRVLEDGDIRGYQDANQRRERVGRKGTLEDDQVVVVEVPRQEEGSGISLLNEPRSRRDGTGETRRTLSWIWTVGYTTSAEDESDDILQVEWAKSRARTMRAKEEVLLLKEEMRRALAFLEWKAQWWTERGSRWAGATSSLSEGISAYASAQASLQSSLSNHFRELWKAPLTTIDESMAEDDDDDEDDDEDDDADDETDGESEVEDQGDEDEDNN